MKSFYTQKERLQLILDITNKLKKYKLKNGYIIDLYNENLCEFIKEFKKITRNYIKQDENNLHEFKGKLEFIEINKTIEYIFPIDKNIEPLFVIRMN